jgi:hypothetical protein
MMIDDIITAMLPQNKLPRVRAFAKLFLMKFILQK